MLINKEKWLLNEIDSWLKEGLVGEETANALSGRYTPKKNINMLITLFSIIGAILIGTGVILICAKNWDIFPVQARISLAFLPLLVSHALVVYAVRVKYESIAWRESVAILNSASVFTVIAMVSRIFHLSSDYGLYLLICGLLSLPVMYILNSVSLLPVYLWAVINGSALLFSPMNALIMLGLFALGALFVFLKNENNGARLVFKAWVTVAAGFATVMVMGYALDCSLLLTSLCYFTLLFSAGPIPDRFSAPFRIIGISGALVTAAILTFESMWSYRNNPVNSGGGVFICVMLALIIWFTARLFKRDRLMFYPVTPLALLCVLRFIWAFYNYSFYPFYLFFMGASNIIMLFIGIAFIVYGVKNMLLPHTNVGMASVCSVIIIWFFNGDYDFLWRGITFLVIGAAFLLVNVRLIRAGKQTDTRGADE